MKLETLQKHLEERTEKTSSCWYWSGKTSLNGAGVPYGYICFQNKRIPITHVALFFATGKWPSNQVNHRCHNTLCVNPAHLYDGTQKDNVADMWRANRQRCKPQCGQDNGMAKLTLKQVKTIRYRYATGHYTLMKLAKQYHVSHVTIWYVVTKITWK